MVRLFILFILIPMLAIASEQSLIVPWFNVSGKLKVNTLAASSIVTPTVTATNFISTGTYTQLAAGSYLNWGSTTGSAGYGIRSNAGTLQYKHSGGSWITVQPATTINNTINFGAATDSSIRGGLTSVSDSILISNVNGYIKNPGFEDWALTYPAGWTKTLATGNTITKQASGAKLGTNCAKFTITVGAGYGRIISSVVPIEPLCSYRVGIWAKCEAVDVQDASIAIKVRDGDNYWLQSNLTWDLGENAVLTTFLSGGTTLNTTWKYYYADFVARDVNSLYVLLDHNRNSIHTFYIDEFNITKTPSDQNSLRKIQVVDTLQVLVKGYSNTAVLAANKFVGSVAGNVTGNITGNVTGTLTGSLTGSSVGLHTNDVEPNMVVNGGFENWSGSNIDTWTNEDTNYWKKITSGQYESSNCVQLIHVTAGSYIVSPTMSARGDAYYKLSCYTKGENGGEDIYFWIADNAGYRWNGSEWASGSGQWNISNMGTTWNRNSTIFKTRPGISTLQISRINRTSYPDTSYLDAVRLEPLFRTDIDGNNDYFVAYPQYMNTVYVSDDSIDLNMGFDGTAYNQYFEAISTKKLNGSQVTTSYMTIDIPKIQEDWKFTSDFIRIALCTQTNTGNEQIDIYVYEGSTLVGTLENQYSSSAATWKNIDIPNTFITSGQFVPNDKMTLKIIYTSDTVTGSPKYVRTGLIKIKF